MYGLIPRVSISVMLFSPSNHYPRSQPLAFRAQRGSPPTWGWPGHNRWDGSTAIGHSQETILFYGDLHIVMLIEATVGAVFHSARLWVGKVVLVFVTRSRNGRPRGASTRVVPCPPSFLFPSTHFGFILGLFGLVAFLGTGFRDGLGLSQVRQPVLAEGDLVFDDHTFRQLDLVGLFAEFQ